MIDYRVVIDGRDITNSLKSRVKSISVIDESGIVSDRLTIKLDDQDGKLAIPKIGVKCDIAFGGSGLTPMGAFTIDEVAISDKRVMRIMGKGFDSFTDVKTKKEGRSFKTKNFGVIARVIANDNNLSLKMSKELESYEFEKSPIQQKESDMRFLSRLARGLDGDVKIAGNNIAIFKKGEGKSLSGRTLKEIDLNVKDLIDWNCSFKGITEYKTVVARYFDREKAGIEKVEKGKSGPVFEFQKTFSDRKEAENAAIAKLNEETYKSKTMNFSIENRTDIKAEIIINISGIRKEIDGKWVVKRAEHTLTETAGHKVGVRMEPYIKG